MTDENLDSTFRRQALDSLRIRRSESGMEYLSTPQRVGGGLAILLVVALIIFSAIATIPIRVVATGKLVATEGMSILSPNSDGIVAEILAAPGESIAAGDPVISIVRKRQSSSGRDIDLDAFDSLNSRIDLLKERLARETDRWTEVTRLYEEQGNSYQEISASYEKALSDIINMQDILGSEYMLLENIAKHGAISRIDLNRAKKDIIELEINRAQAVAQIQSIQQQRERLKLSSRQDELAHAAAVRSIEADIETARTELSEAGVAREHVLSSTIDGFLVAVSPSIGDFVRFGDA